jgi:hypothetical protein
MAAATALLVIQSASLLSAIQFANCGQFDQGAAAMTRPSTNEVERSAQTAIPEAHIKTAPALNIAKTASLILRRDLKIAAATAKPTIEPSKNSAARMIDAKPAVADIVCLPSTAFERTSFDSAFCCGPVSVFRAWPDECVRTTPMVDNSLN